MMVPRLWKKLREYYAVYAMGLAKGRTCRSLLAQEIAKKRGIKIEEVDVPTYRAPVKPVKLGMIVGGEKDA